MLSSRFPRKLIPLALWVGLQGWSLPCASGQAVGQAGREAYFRAVGDHFQVPLQEVVLIGDWDLSPDEVPVVLFLAQRAGVSSDALVGLRRAGRPWRDVASRFGLGTQAFHVPLPEDPPSGILARAFRAFRETEAREWGRIQLEDEEIVALVNLRVLSQVAQASPARVLQCREEAGSFLACFPRLRGR